jgi:hypothetical protein
MTKLTEGEVLRSFVVRFMMLPVLVLCFGLVWLKLILAAAWLLGAWLLLVLLEVIVGVYRVARAYKLTVGAYRRAKADGVAAPTAVPVLFEPVAALVPWRGLPPTSLLARVAIGAGAVTCWALGVVLGLGVEVPPTIVLGVEGVAGAGVLIALGVWWWRGDRAARVYGAPWREVLIGSPSRERKLGVVAGSVFTLALVLWSVAQLAAVGSPWQFGADPAHWDAAVRAEAIGNLALLGWCASVVFLSFLGGKRRI